MYTSRGHLNSNFIQLICTISCKYSSFTAVFMKTYISCTALDLQKCFYFLYITIDFLLKVDNTYFVGKIVKYYHKNKGLTYFSLFLTESQGQRDGWKGAKTLSSSVSFSPSEVGFPFSSLSSLKKSIL